MAQPYVGEIRMFAGNFSPAGWMFCQGQLISIDENETLFQLIGTTYGGDGQAHGSFGLPDLRGRVPVHQGNGFILAQTGGVETVTLTVNQIPAHTHPLIGSGVNGAEASPANALLANSTLITPYAPETPNVAMAANAVGPVGGSQPHTNFQPYLCINFIISLFGIFPPPP
jgi:microcystin-dependent protein